MNIRKAELSDAAAMAKIFKDDLGEPDCTEQMVSSIFPLLDPERECVFVAEDDKKDVCGVIHVEIYQLLYFEKMVNNLGIAVSSSHRRMGIGKLLLKAAEDWGREHGAKYMRINSGETRKGAHEFYRSQGYDSEKIQLRFLKKL